MISAVGYIKKRVLSIQSHVVHGYVGNKSATFPLQLLGFDVDAINSVQFSNHTGYNVKTGQILNDIDLRNLINGLHSNDLLKSYSHLLTGYIGDVSFLREIAAILKQLRLIDSTLIYVCDPVLGDNGRMCVPKELLPVYRTEIIPLANIVTPNQYEVEIITEIKITNHSDAINALNWFHDKGVDIAVISSCELGKSDELTAYVSKKNGPCFSLNIPKQGNEYTSALTGTGDLFAALFLAHSYRLESDKLNVALERTISTLQAVIKKTIDHILADMGDKNQKVTPFEKELKIIQSKNAIEKPLIELKAIRIN